MNRKYTIPYPPKIASRIRPSRAGDTVKTNARGHAATFLCGISVRFDLAVGAGNGVLGDIYYSTNGCGYVVAAADLLAETLRKRRLVDLHALDFLDEVLESQLGPVPGERRHCLNLCVDAMRSALADFRNKQLDEWTGDDPLICSCFGVSEGEIETVIDTRPGISVDDIGQECNAGTGCGSCQQIIQAILDSKAAESPLQ